jgi:hypothetical protein
MLPAFETVRGQSEEHGKQIKLLFGSNFNYKVSRLEC